MRRGRLALLMLGISLCASALMALWPFGTPPEVETAVVKGGELVRSVMLRGSVCYARQTPYVSLRDGVVRSVYVQQGDRVRKGELLFALDTSAQERALAALYQLQYAQRHAMTQLEDAAPLLFAQSELEWQQQRAQLLSAVEASCIRAEADGVMGAVYVQEGSPVAASTPLGTAHDEQRCIAAALPSGYSQPDGGTAAVAYGQEALIALVLQRTAIAEGTALMYFEAAEQAALDALDVGETVDVEMITSVQPAGALVPLAAITAQEQVWTVTDGKAYLKPFAMGECSRTHALADESWAGEAVVLHPERYDLEDGMRVRERQ